MPRNFLDDDYSLADAIRQLHAHPMTVNRVPWIVRLVENPKYKIFGRNVLLLPGAMDLDDHDLIHVLLDKGFSLCDEAYVIGFTMGSSQKMRLVHTLFYWCIARLLYPAPYRFNSQNFAWFQVGVTHGKSYGKLDVSTLKSNIYEGWPVKQLREEFLERRYVDRYLAGKSSKR